MSAGPVVDNWAALEKAAAADNLRLDRGAHSVTIYATLGYEIPLLTISGHLGFDDRDEDAVLRGCVGCALTLIRRLGT